MTAVLAMAAWLFLISGRQSAPPPVPAVAANPLAAVRRIFVDSFGTDADSREAQVMVVTALVASKRFSVTEEQGRADAVLRGVAVDRRSQQVHAITEGTKVGHAAAADSSLDTETDEAATISVRLIDKDGDVIWSTVQQSHGGKYEGAEASAAGACVAQLMRDSH